MKYCIFILIVSSLCYSLANMKNSTHFKIRNARPIKQLSLQNLLKTFLKTCDLGLKKIIIFDRLFTNNTFTAVADVQPRISVSLFSRPVAWKLMRRYQFNDIKVDAVIIAIPSKNTWNSLTHLFDEWRFNRDCIILIFPIPLYSCDHYKEILILIMRFYFSSAYVICLENNRYIRVFTHDPYGDTGPPKWHKISQDFIWGKNWTFYERNSLKGMSELCSGFNFKRTNPSNNTFVILGFRNAHIQKSYQKFVKYEKLPFDIMDNHLIDSVQDKVKYFKRLLKIRFMYFLINSGTSEIKNIQAYVESGIDATIHDRVILNEKLTWDFLFPVRYEPYIILSHDRGLLTPIEKIAKFYGVWTLSSLVIILSITFIIIWLSTKNISLATFDVIRLLINTGIFGPINTRPLKIFFCMIFLYFLIIHATFNGHLAEFLTEDQSRPNIDTIDDLKDSRVTRIYHFGYQYDGAKEYDVLRQKSKQILRDGDCRQVINSSLSACIAPLLRVYEIWITTNSTNTLHISKNKIGLSLFSYMYRPGFPLRDKFNWALMTMIEIGFVDRVEQNKQYNFFKTTQKKFVARYVHHRPIAISDIYFALVLLIIGYCAGFISFLFEISFNMFSKKIKNLHCVKNGNKLKIVVKPNRCHI